jgi:hypothetical protein
LLNDSKTDEPLIVVVAVFFHSQAIYTCIVSQILRTGRAESVVGRDVEVCGVLCSSRAGKASNGKKRNSYLGKYLDVILQPGEGGETKLIKYT